MIMNKYCRLFPLLPLLGASAFAQDALVFKGTVKCIIAADERATRGAQNVVVVPGFVPNKSGMTGQQGYYELNTAWPLQRLEGKYVMVYFVSSCRDCEIKKNVFVSEDQVRQTGKNLRYLTLETVQMRAACKNTELKPFQSDSIYSVFSKLPPQDLEKISSANVVTAAPGVLNVLTNVVTAAVVGGGSSDVNANIILPGKIHYGRFLLSSPMHLSLNTGFNFAPGRDLSEAVFWNPSALTNGYQNAGVHLLSNFRTNHKVSAYARLTDKFWLSGGAIVNKQDEFRPTVFRGLLDTSDHPRTLNEYAVFLSPSYKISSKLSVGVSVKSIWQSFNRPSRVNVVTDGSGATLSNDFVDSTEDDQSFDADVSFSYAPSGAFKIGLTLMNLAGTELWADSYPAQRNDVPTQKLRSLGLGLCYKWKQFNFGADALATQNELYDVSVGVNYIPLNNVLLSAGYAFRQKSFSAALRVKYFRLGFVNDNDFLANEQKTGKSSLLNGRIYSGLSFVF